MALIECPDCNAEVSDTSKQCIKCGGTLPKPAKKPSKLKKFIIWFIVFSIALNLVVKLVSPSQEEHAATEKARLAAMSPQERKDDAIKNYSDVCGHSSLGRYEYILRGLKDPDSFQYIDRATVYNKKKDSMVTIVQYRAKNGFGGYVVSNYTCISKYNPATSKFE